MSHFGFPHRFSITYRRKTAAEVICPWACPSRAGQMIPEPHQMPSDWPGGGQTMTTLMCVRETEPLL